MERRIELEGCHNFRDLGGYPVESGGSLRWRVLFRSDGLHHLTGPDVAVLRDRLGVRDVVDLRSSGEVASEGRGPIEDGGFRVQHLPLFDGRVVAGAERLASAELSLADRYFLLAEYAREPIARVIVALAEAPGPAVYHCAAGKDRTGLVSAVLLGLLGVREELIVADYAASQEKLEEIVGRLLSTRGYQEMLAALPPDTLHANPETMIALLSRMRERYGGMEGYARAIGVPDASLARLRERMLLP